VPNPRHLLVTLTGRDRPGVTSALFAALAPYDIDVVDVEQVVIHDRLVLGVLLAVRHSEDAVRAAAEAAGGQFGLDVEITVTTEDAAGPRRRGRLHVTVLGAPLRPGAVAGIAGRIADTGANIDRIVRIARYPVTAIEFEVCGADHDKLRALLSREAAVQHVDVAVQRSGLHRRGKRLVVMDVDSTLIQGEVIEMLAEHAGCGAEVARVTEEAMRGELDFAESLRARVALLEGLDASALDEVRAAVQLSPGARTLVRTLKRLDYRIALVSGGFSQIVDAIAAELGIDYAVANELEIVDGRLTGRVVGPIVDRAEKANALERFAQMAGVPLAQTVAVGDGANDLDMLARAGLGIAFNAKPVVRQAAHTTVNVPYLDTVLYLLGIPRREIDAADAADGVAPVPTR
jgi:phosphoserine phosphatase